MGCEIGSILEGKVTGITKFGAFVALPENQTGMVHISEVAHTYVNDIREHLTEGQIVNVKVVGMDASGRINLSIKKTLESPPRPAADRPAFSGGGARKGASRGEPQTFEDKIKQFMQDSESKMSALKQHGDKRGGPRRRH